MAQKRMADKDDASRVSKQKRSSPIQSCTQHCPPKASWVSTSHINLCSMRGEYFIRSASFRPNHVEYLHVLNDMRVDGALEAVAVATVLLGSAALHTQRVAA